RTSLRILDIGEAPGIGDVDRVVVGSGRSTAETRSGSATPVVLGNEKGRGSVLEPRPCPSASKPVSTSRSSEASDACLGTAGPPGTTVSDADRARVESSDAHEMTLPGPPGWRQPSPPNRNLDR